MPSANRIVLTVSLLFGIFASPVLSTVRAADEITFKPIVTVSTGPIDGIFDAAAKVANIFEASDQLSLVRDGVAYDGLDLTKPVAFSLLSAGEAEIMPVIILPIADLEKFQAPLETLMKMGGSPGMKLQKIEKDRFSLQTPAGVYVFLQRKGWVLGTMESLSDRLPDSPEELLQGLEKENLFAFRVDFANTDYEELSTLLVPLQMIAAMNPAPGLQQNLDMMDKSLELCCKEFDQVTVAYKLDSKTADFACVLDYKLKPGSTTSKQVAAMKDTKTAFGGFFKPEGAIAAMVGTGKFDKEQAELGKEQIVPILEGLVAQLEENDDERSLALIPAVDILRKLIFSSYDKGETDCAATMTGNGIFLGASVLGDGKTAEKFIDQLVEPAKNEDAAAVNKYFKRNASTLEGYAVNTISAPLKELVEAAGEDVDDLPETIADKNVTLIFGVKDDACCFAGGLGTVAEMEKALSAAIADSKTPKALPTTVAVFSVAQLGKWVKSLDLPHVAYYDPNVAKYIDAMIAAGDDCLITVDVDYGTDVVSAKLTATGKHFTLIKKMVDIAQTSRLEDVDFDTPPGKPGLRKVD
ncbi:MAG TPA: hypothetical protein DEB39_05890 [Planctomycetaceae bacterium]|nr:hypothetical protein [Planctomycetaceae bacterium]